MATVRTAEAHWEGSLMDGQGEVELVSSGLGSFQVSWRWRAEQPEGHTSPEELIAAAAPVDGATKGSFAWTVTGPPSGTARVRVSWTDDPAVSDTSDVTFQIRPPG